MGHEIKENHRIRAESGMKPKGLPEVKTDLKQNVAGKRMKKKKQEVGPGETC